MLRHHSYCLDYFTIKTESGMYHAHDGNPASTRLFPVCKGKARPIRPSRGPPHPGSFPGGKTGAYSQRHVVDRPPSCSEIPRAGASRHIDAPSSSVGERRLICPVRIFSLVLICITSFQSAATRCVIRRENGLGTSAGAGFLACKKFVRASPAPQSCLRQ